jgi:NAD(P) transhydrogenase subunit alpha
LAILGILKETGGENRVSIVPENISQLNHLKLKICVEKGAGEKAFISDQDYISAGAEVYDREQIISASGIITSVNPPENNILSAVNQNCVIISVFNPFANRSSLKILLERKITAFSLELMPRTSRAQIMDVLSSQATAAGYKAVIEAASHLKKFFPMLMTAAGSIRPAKVLVLGAGVAGLMAISTARRLGAVVEAFDTRKAVKDEVQSLGARFVEVEGARDDLTSGGYAVEQSEEYIHKQRTVIREHAVKSDIIISTAQIPNRKAPLLITAETVHAMKPGSVIVDMAASTGGNCELTENGKTIDVNGVTIIGNSNLASGLSSDASLMYGKNLVNFIKLIVRNGVINPDFGDELVSGTCISYNGEIINEKLKSHFNGTDN